MRARTVPFWPLALIVFLLPGGEAKGDSGLNGFWLETGQATYTEFIPKEAPENFQPLPFFVRHNYNFVGAGGAWDWRLTQRLFGGVSGSYIYGVHDYDSAATGQANSVPFYDARFEPALSLLVRSSRASDLFLNLGLGWRFYSEEGEGRLSVETRQDRLALTQGGRNCLAAGSASCLFALYDRQTKQFSLFYGLEYRTGARYQIRYYGAFGYRQLVWGKQYSHLYQVSDTNPKVKNIQREGYGIEARLGMILPLDRVSAGLEFYAYNWHVETSEREETSIGIVLEPENRIEKFGVRMRILLP